MGLNRKEVQQKLADMTPRSWLYQDVKTEMKKRGHWKGKPRGKSINEVLKDKN